MATRKQYELVTGPIIAALEESIKSGKTSAPWEKPWKAPARLNRDRNGASGYAYTGLNPFSLWLRAASKGWESKLWFTFKQVKDLGGYVKKGEKSTVVYFWKMILVDDKDPDTQEIKKKKIPLIKISLVFNLEQTENVKLPKRELETYAEELAAWDPIVEAQAVLDNYVNKEGGPSLSHNGGDRAFYRPAADAISLPNQSQFPKADEYYSTAFHEAGHSTGHQSRLKRLEGEARVAAFGSNEYSKEELVAEFTSALLSAEVGIDSTRENSTAYLRGWLSKLKSDPKLAVVAAGKAHKAANYILNGPQKPVEDEEEESK